MKAIKFLYHAFAFQNVISFQVRDDKIVHSKFRACINLFKTNSIYLVGVYFTYYTTIFKELTAQSSHLEVSPFMDLIIKLVHFSQPFLLGIISVIIFRKRKMVYRLAKTSIVISKTYNLLFERTIRVCLMIFLVLQSMMFTQIIFIHYYFYEVSLMSLFTFPFLVLTAVSFHIPFYIILLGFFYMKFVTHLLNNILENIKEFRSIDSIENRLNLVHSMMKKFHSAYGQQLSIAMFWILSMLIVNVS